MRRFAMITLVLSLGIAASAHAAAGDDARLVFVETASVPHNTVANAPVPCATGEGALGGGIRRFGGTTDMWVQESGPQSPAGGTLNAGERSGRWFSSLVNQTGVSTTFATYAVCSASTDATVQTTTLGVAISGDGGRQGSGTMPCPDGQRAVGGGILGVGRLEASGPVDETLDPANTVDGDIPRGWFVSMVTDSAMPPTYRMYALCSPTSTATIKLASKQMTPGEIAAVGVGCPSSQRLLSGGVIGAIPRGEIIGSGPAVNNGLAYTSTDSNNLPTTGLGWRMELHNIGAQATYKVAAVCEAPTPASPTDPTNPNPPTNPPPDPPSNLFTLGQLTRNRDRGTAMLPITVPGPGSVTLASGKLKPQSIEAPAAGDVVVKLKSVGAARQKLRRKGKLKVSAELTFTPSGGTANTMTTETKLKRD